MRTKPVSEVGGYLLRNKTRVLPQIARIPRRDNLAGQTFGQLTVEKCVGRDAQTGARLWGCVCSCGAKIAVLVISLRYGSAVSCGCHKKKVHPPKSVRKPSTCENRAQKDIISRYKSSAKQRGIFWSLTDQELLAKIVRECVYCGSSKGNTRKSHNKNPDIFAYTGMDRLDNSQGYTPENTVACCWTCNRAKSTMGVQEFLDWCDRIAAYACIRVPAAGTKEVPVVKR